MPRDHIYKFDKGLVVTYKCSCNGTLCSFCKRQENNFYLGKEVIEPKEETEYVEKKQESEENDE